MDVSNFVKASVLHGLKISHVGVIIQIKSETPLSFTRLRVMNGIDAYCIGVEENVKPI